MPQSSTASYVDDPPPESPNTYEVKTKFGLFGGITADIALFGIHERNTLYIESIGDETIAKTVGRIRSRGVEVNLAGTSAENINTIASYGYTDAKVLEDPDYARKPLLNAPRHTGSLFPTYNVHNMPSNNTLTFGGGGHGISRHSATSEADYYLPDYSVVDAFAAYKVKSQHPVTLQSNVRNLSDKTYYTSSIATSNLDNQISDPREAQFTVRMKS